MNSSDSPLIATIIVNYGSHELIENAIEDVDLRAAGLVVVIVDNFSTPAERRAVRSMCDRRGWLLELSENRGFAAGVNLGVARAVGEGCEAVVALNPDARADARTLSTLGSHVLESVRELVSPKMIDSMGMAHFRGAQVDMESGQIRSGWNVGDDDSRWRNWLSGACLAFSVAAHAELDGFEEDYFLYWEDVDFSRRAAGLGMMLTVRDDLQVVHDEGGTHGAAHLSRAKSPLYYYYNTRNRLRFAVRHCRSRRQLAKWIWRTPIQSSEIWLRGGRRQIFSQPAGALKAIAGTMSGLVEAFIALVIGPGKDAS